MKLGLQINSYDWPCGASQLGPTLARVAQTADECGFDAIAVDDHLWQHPYAGGPESPKLECYSTLAYLAANTSRARLMPLVTPPQFRHPGLLAKTVTTLDVLSGGRAWLGVGAGHYSAESRGLGIPFPPTTERFQLLEETLQICLRMWDGCQGDERPFESVHYRLERPLNLPQGLTRPHPPIMIAGNGERKTLRLVARYADACNLTPGPKLPRKPKIPHQDREKSVSNRWYQFNATKKLEVLRQHCQAEGRDYHEIEKTCMFRFDVGEDGAKTGELIEQLHCLSEMGIQTVFGVVRDMHRITPLEIIGREVIPAVQDF